MNGYWIVRSSSCRTSRTVFAQAFLRDPQSKVRETALSIHNRAGGGLRSANWHYMKYGDKGEELYDMAKDPHQYTNVVTDPAYADMLHTARSQFQVRMAGAR